MVSQSHLSSALNNMRDFGLLPRHNVLYKQYLTLCLLLGMVSINMIAKCFQRLPEELIAVICH